jgi:hypothetical protein
MEIKGPAPHFLTFSCGPYCRDKKKYSLVRVRLIVLLNEIDCILVEIDQVQKVKIKIVE